MVKRRIFRQNQPRPDHRFYGDGKPVERWKYIGLGPLGGWPVGK